MAWDPIRQRKFVARKDKFDLDENIHLDKVRNEGAGKKKIKVQVWSALAVAVILLVAALIAPSVAQTAVSARHMNALANLDKTKEVILETTLNVPDDDTVFVVKENGRYFLFWYQKGANAISAGDDGKGSQSETYNGLIEISDPHEYCMPINVKEGESLVYPFKDEPIYTSDNGSFALADGLQILSGYKLVEYEMNEEMQKLISDNVKLYKAVRCD